MNKRDAYKAGKERGYSIASWNDLPEIGSKIDKSVDWQGMGDTVTLGNAGDYFEAICHEAEDNNRQFTPFKFTASEFNKQPNSEALWDEFDRGISKGISDNWKERKSYYKE